MINIYQIKDILPTYNIFWPLQLWSVSLVISKKTSQNINPFEFFILGIIKKFNDENNNQKIIGKIMEYTGFSEKTIFNILENLEKEELIITAKNLTIGKKDIKNYIEKYKISQKGIDFLKTNVNIKTETEPGYKLITSCYGNNDIMGLIPESKLIPIKYESKSMKDQPIINFEEKLKRKIRPDTKKIKIFLNKARDNENKDISNNQQYEEESLIIPLDLNFESEKAEEGYIEIPLNKYDNRYKKAMDPFKTGNYSWFEENEKHLNSAIQGQQLNKEERWKKEKMKKIK